VSSGKTTTADLEKKFGALQKHLGIPIVFLAATDSDQYRKPALGMWKHCLEEIFCDFTVNMKESFYCGDAAGRPKVGDKPKDFTDTDIKFAINIGIRFLTPEECFLNEVDDRIPTAFKKQLLANTSDKGAASKKEEVK
jgi:bifunctional polynucleotide phosphatase/kinase